MVLSFCTTCRDRLADLQQTLPRNLGLLREDEEIVVLDYNSVSDDVGGWLKETYRQELEAGRLRYYRERSAPRFFMAHAKNVAHLLGSGKFLVNLDADNYLDETYLDVVRDDWSHASMLYPHKGSGGFKGRIAIRRNIFTFMGGYDEDMNLGYGYEECDLYRRAQRRVLVRDVRINQGTVIPTNAEQKAAGQLDKNMTIIQTNAQHRKISEANLKAKRYIANPGRRWGEAEVADFRGIVLKTWCVDAPLTD